MKKLSEYSFRELQEQYIYLDGIMASGEATGLVAYGVINHEQGLCFMPLSAANFDIVNKSLKLLSLEDNLKEGIPVMELGECSSMLLPSSIPAFEQFKEQVEINKAQNLCSEQVAKTRQVLNLDSCRTLDNPDVVSVQLVKGDTIESCYVLLEGIQEMFFYGILLQEPSQALGVHAGEIISFYNVRNQEGIMCLAVFPE